jgi:two-component system, NarL family, invasion response regulator UvrY
MPLKVIECMKTILIADDHEIVRHGIKMMIKSFDETCTFYEASTCVETEKLLKTQQIQYIVLDLFLTDGNAFPIVDSIAEQYPDAGILIYTMNAEKVYAKRLMQKGVRGFVSKQASVAELEQAIKDFLNDKKHIYSTLMKELFKEGLSNVEPNPIDLLSDRELEVVEYLIMGLGAKEISNKMNVGISTISRFRQRALEKFGVENNVELKDKFLLYREKG